MNKDAIELLIQKNPRLRRDRAKLEAMQAGTFCIHRTWGMGTIQGYDEASNMLIIDFDQKPGHRMDPVFCVDKLEILAGNDILVQAQKEPAKVKAMIEQRPTDLIAELLNQSTEGEMTSTELEAVLSRLLGPDFKKWWTATKKALVKDPRIQVPSKKSDPYVLRDEPVKAEDEILDEFFETKAPKKKIALGARLIELSVKHSDIETQLPNILKELTACVAETKQLNPGERLYGIWVRNDLARFIHTDVETLEPSSASIILSSFNLSQLADQIPGTHYKRYVDLIQRVHPTEWDKHVLELLKNSSGKFTSECISFLFEHKREELVAETLQRWLVEQNLKGPLLVWILKNRNARKYQECIKPLITPRLLNSILFAIDYEALQNASTRRIPLAELVVEDQSIIAELLESAPTETAHDLAQTLMLNQGFEDLSKKSILARFIKLFPSVQPLVSGKSGNSAAQTATKEGLIVSKWSLDLRKAEYETLVGERIPKNKQDIADARAHGDLKENSEYKMARQEQDVLLARKSELELDLGRAQVTDFADAPTDAIGIGSRIELHNLSTKEKARYAILGAWDSSPEKNILSYQTPLARALISKRVGDQVEVEIDGHREQWKVQSIERWVDHK